MSAAATRQYRPMSTEDARKAVGKIMDDLEAEGLEPKSMLVVSTMLQFAYASHYVNHHEGRRLAVDHLFDTLHDLHGQLISMVVEYRHKEWPGTQ